MLEKFLQIAGRVFLFIRYRRRTKEILKEKYNNSYSVAGRKVLPHAIVIILFMLVKLTITLVAIFYMIKKGT